MLAFLSQIKRIIKIILKKKLSVLQEETPAQLYSCEFCEILRNTAFTEHL